MSDKKYNLILDKKTGFKITDPATPVIINDYRGKVFYDNSELKNKEIFNLPDGNYNIISGKFDQLFRPHKFRLNRLPLPQRIKGWPVDFKIVFAENPHKATISWRDRTIIFDTSLLVLSLPDLFFILYHEFAHSKYINEKYTDALAENLMLMQGFNPSQVSSAAIRVLSDRQQERKNETFNRFKDRLS